MYFQAPTYHSLSRHVSGTRSFGLQVDRYKPKHPSNLHVNEDMNNIFCLLSCASPKVSFSNLK